ncbi:winged helix-turn-helix domain-containing protein [Streptomyces sp. NPDC094143]
MLHVGYTIQGVWKLPWRHGWSVQVPLRRVTERDDEARGVEGRGGCR